MIYVPNKSHYRVYALKKTDWAFARFVKNAVLETVLKYVDYFFMPLFAPFFVNPDASGYTAATAML